MGSPPIFGLCTVPLAPATVCSYHIASSHRITLHHMYHTQHEREDSKGRGFVYTSNTINNQHTCCTQLNALCGYASTAVAIVYDVLRTKAGHRQTRRLMYVQHDADHKTSSQGKMDDTILRASTHSRHNAGNTPPQIERDATTRSGTTVVGAEPARYLQTARINPARHARAKPSSAQNRTRPVRPVRALRPTYISQHACPPRPRYRPLPAPDKNQQTKN